MFDHEEIANNLGNMSISGKAKTRNEVLPPTNSIPIIN